MRVARHRAKILREVWSAVGVRRYPDQARCPWQRCEECSCDPARPCQYERRLVNAAQAEAEGRFGSLLSGLVVSALVDCARAIAGGKDATMPRLKLAELLSKDQNQKALLALQTRRLDAEEAARKPRGPEFDTYIAENYGPNSPRGRAAAARSPG